MDRPKRATSNSTYSFCECGHVYFSSDFADIYRTQNANDLNETILESGLSQLPRLLALHVIGCLRLDHSSILRCIAHTPLLESLSFTTYVNVRVCSLL